MSTGKPKSSGNGNGASIKLEYAGKKHVDEILASKPAHLVRIGAHHQGGNRLIFGENLGVLAALAKDESVVGKVKLIYIDPPFSTQSAFESRMFAHAYDDTLAGAEFIEFLRERLILLHRLLADDGSLYLHLDERMTFHMRVILDEIFGPKNYRNCITRKKCNPKNYTRKTYGNVADYILFYTKGNGYCWNRQAEPWTDERAKEYRYVDTGTGRRYMKVPVHAPGVRNGETGKPWRGVMPPPGKHWQYQPSKLDEMDARGEIYWLSTGNPRRKVYLDQSDGVPVQDIWLDMRDAHNQNINITGYPTEKPQALLKRIVLSSSNPGDMVLDCFAGSGTTLAAAAELNRRWIGVDSGAEAIRTILQRFALGMEPMGDFVSARTEKEESKCLPLFDTPETPKTSTHVPITDYVLYAEQGRENELQSLLSLNKSAPVVTEQPTTIAHALN